jgi:hypothetical protein
MTHRKRGSQASGVPEHVFRISLSLIGAPHLIEPDLEEKELAAIGLVGVQWAYLEHAILASTLQLAEANNVPLPADAQSLAFSKRLRAWRLMIERGDSKKPERAQLLRAVSKAANLQQKRHRITHGLWTWDIADPMRLTAFSFRPRVGFETDFNFNSLIRLATLIGELNFHLTFPAGRRRQGNLGLTYDHKGRT